MVTLMLKDARDEFKRFCFSLVKGKHLVSGSSDKKKTDLKNKMDRF